MVAVTEWRGVVFAVRDAPSGESGVISSLYVCPRPECRKPTLVFFDATRYSRSPVLERPPQVEKAGQLPRGTAQPIADLPPEIERDRLEAWSCLYGEDVRAAVIMGRAAVQRAARFLKARWSGSQGRVAGSGTKRRYNACTSRVGRRNAHRGGRRGPSRRTR